MFEFTTAPGNPLRAAAPRQHPAWLSGLLAAAAIAASLAQLQVLLPASLWATALFRPDHANISEMVVHYAWLPRFAMAWLAGGGLALAGAVLQQALRNPLAEPTTLGIAAGAQLALQTAGLWAPAWLIHGRSLVALTGGGAAALLVFALAARRQLTPLALILAGMVVGLLCAAVSTSLLLLHDYYLNLSAVFIWSSGSLDQGSWAATRLLALQLAIALPVIAMIARQLTLFDLGDAIARSTGLWLVGTRLVAVAAAVGIGCCVVSAVGIIGFIGLAGPIIAGVAGARRLHQRLVWAPVIGGALLCMTDQLVQVIGGNGGGLLPAGVATAILGVPLLLWQTWRMRERRGAGPARPPALTSGHDRSPARIIGPCLGLLLLALWLALDLGRGPAGWHVSDGSEFAALLPWRLPRAAAAMAAGGLLALSGALMQRLTGNPLAAPDILGVSSGAAFGAITAMLLAPAAAGVQVTASAIGALLTLAATLALASRSGTDSDRVLVIGIALTFLLNALTALVMARGNLQSAAILNWLAGSTYGVSDLAAMVLGLCAIGAVLALPLVARWLLILPLGRAIATTLGVPPQRGPIVILVVSGVAAAAATVVVGPLGFVGLLAPHCTRLLGLRRPLPHALGSVVFGAAIMVCADWIGRNALFPYELPAGLVASLIGGPYFIWLIAARPGTSPSHRITG